jgi:hypothetical protein
MYNHISRTWLTSGQNLENGGERGDEIIEVGARDRDLKGVAPLGCADLHGVARPVEHEAPRKQLHACTSDRGAKPTHLHTWDNESQTA